MTRFFYTLLKKSPKNTDKTTQNYAIIDEYDFLKTYNKNRLKDAFKSVSKGDYFEKNIRTLPGS